jgi:hypothetical protein
MANSYSKAKGRREGGQFFALPYRILEHENFIRLSPRANKLFTDLLPQFNGKNNGDLTAAFSVMKKRGWKSKETLHLAIDELLHYGWLIRTRVGGLNKSCHLYAFSFLSIDDCSGKIDCKPTKAPPGGWNQQHDKWVKPSNYQAIDTRRKLNSRVRNTYQSVTDSVPVALVRG